MAKVFKGIRDEITLTVQAELMGDHGETTQEDVVLTYKKINNNEAVKKLFKDLETGELDELTVVSEHLKAWNIEYDDGTPVELNDETLIELWEIVPYRNAIVDGFVQVQLGYKTLAAKNS